LLLSSNSELGIDDVVLLAGGRAALASSAHARRALPVLSEAIDWGDEPSTPGPAD
jgi:hypothetical protein